MLTAHFNRFNFVSLTRFLSGTCTSWLSPRERGSFLRVRSRALSGRWSLNRGLFLRGGRAARACGGSSLLGQDAFFNDFFRIFLFASSRCSLTCRNRNFLIFGLRFSSTGILLRGLYLLFWYGLLLTFTFNEEIETALTFIGCSSLAFLRLRGSRLLSVLAGSYFLSGPLRGASRISLFGF